MNKLNFPPPSFANPSTVGSDAAIRLFDLETSRRLIVLISTDADSSDATPRIWELANATESGVQLLGLCREPSQEPALRRCLVTMSALISDTKVSVETKVEIGTNWVELVKRNYQPGDMIVCMADQPAGIGRRPLSQILESNLRIPVYVLSTLHPPKPRSTWLSQVIAWSGFLGIVLGFFLLQAKIVQLPKDWSQTALLILLLIPEFWLIWVWNNLFG